MPIILFTKLHPLEPLVDVFLYCSYIVGYIEEAWLHGLSDFRRRYGHLNFFLIKSNSQKSDGAKSGEYGGWRIVIPARLRQPVTF